MRQTKKGKQRYFGMKLHCGTDSRSGLVHSASVTAAKGHMTATKWRNCRTAWKPVSTRAVHNRGNVRRERFRAMAPKAKDFTIQRAYRNRPLGEADKHSNWRKSSVRCKVEHLSLSSNDCGVWRRFATAVRPRMLI